MEQDKTGWIYVLNDQLGHYKIGKAKDLDNRIKQLKIQLPYRVTVEIAVRVPDRHQAEKDMHKEFGEHRVNGEWFKLNSCELASLWSDFFSADPTFSHKNVFTEVSGVMRNFGWYECEGVRDADDKSGCNSLWVFNHFKSLCLDEACDTFGFPRTDETRELLAPNLMLAARRAELASLGG